MTEAKTVVSVWAASHNHVWASGWMWNQPRRSPLKGCFHEASPNQVGVPGQPSEAIWKEWSSPFLAWKHLRISVKSFPSLFRLERRHKGFLSGSLWFWPWSLLCLLGSI